jgi:peptidoglycan/xylan/chitin deacetylase (PgdA/CDA1 family)
LFKFDTNYENLPAFTKIPSWLRVYNKDICWKVSDQNRNIYLSFDDGPHPVITPYILNVLADYKVKATFFCIGTQVQKHPDIYNRIIEEGHTVGNHSFSHRSGWKLPVDEYVSDVKRASEMIQSKLFRPPYGRITPLQFKVLKNSYKIIMWDILSKDYDPDLSDARVIKNATSDLTPGSIIVMHDNDKTAKRMENILPNILDIILKDGWEFKTIV